jgi:hypothetical protein
LEIIPKIPTAGHISSHEAPSRFDGPNSRRAAPFARSTLAERSKRSTGTGFISGNSASWASARAASSLETGLFSRMAEA